MKNGLLLLLCGLLFVGACKKPGDGKTHPNPQLLAHFNFQPGSYWIYYDSVTGLEDSMYVYRNYIQGTNYEDYIEMVLNFEHGMKNIHI